MNDREKKLLSAILAAHEKMANLEGSARISQNNFETVQRLVHECDASGYLSEVLRLGRQAGLVSELAKEAHDALAHALDVARG